MCSKSFPLIPLLYEPGLRLLSCQQQSASTVELPFSTVHPSPWYFASCTSLAKYLTPTFCRVKAFAEPNVSIQALRNYPEMFQQPILNYPFLSSQLILGLHHTHTHTHHTLHTTPQTPTHTHTYTHTHTLHTPHHTTPHHTTHTLTFFCSVYVCWQVQFGLL
jgi:hypothetical protein